MDYTKLSKSVSYILRHAPQEYGLKLNSDGWVEIPYLCTALKQDGFEVITKEDLLNMIEGSEKKRHEIVGSKIRAIYGHSVDTRIVYEKATPPKILYHGTARRFLGNILEEGLISKERQYVHLSQDVETAINVGKRHDDKPVILKINAMQGYEKGLEFYFVNEKIWLVDGIPVEFIEVESDYDTKYNLS